MFPVRRSLLQVAPVELSSIFRISSIRVQYPEDLRSLENRMTVHKTLRSVHKKFPAGVPLLDPIQDMGIASVEVKEITTVG